MTTRPVNVTLELSEEFLSDILVTAFDGSCGGSWYWAQPDCADWLELSVPNEACSTWLSVKVREQEASGDKAKRFKLDHEALVKGIELLFKPGVLPKRSDIRNAVLQQEAGDIDIDGADVLVQLACFGALIYG
jgi:hypothetical protein